MTNLYDFHDPKRHDGTEEELLERLSDLAWDMGIICGLVGWDMVEFAKTADKINQECYEKEIRESDPQAWLDIYFDHTKAIKT